MGKWQALTMIVVVMTATGCSWFGSGDEQRRLEEGSSQAVVIPEELDKPQFTDIMPIPEIADPRGLAGTDYEVRMPDALSTSFGVEQIVLRRLGEERWVFLDIPPSVVWPKVVQFWESHNIDVQDADPSTGILVSRWLPARGANAEEILDSLKQRTVLRNSSSIDQHKFRLKMEPGIRSGSTELYLEHRQMPAGAPSFLSEVEWIAKSDNLELEDELLRTMAFYLGDNITQGTFSMMATGLQTSSRAELIPDRTTPVLKYRLDFNRAWATVGDALENARVSVDDLDRTQANYYVYYSSDHNPEPGFFGRLFGGDDKISGEGNRYTVHLDEAENEVHVTVLQDEREVDSLIAERLLKIIKEYST